MKSYRTLKGIILVCAFLLQGCNNKKKKFEAPEISAVELTESSVLHAGCPKLTRQMQVEVEADRVYFKFDNSKLSRESERTVAGLAEFLKKHSESYIEIQGNCDSKGSADYNVALGERRAEAVASYLAKLGIDRNRIKTVSYGSRVLVQGDDEDSYSKNRVSIFVMHNKS